MNQITLYFRLFLFSLLSSFSVPALAIKEPTDRVFAADELAKYVGEDNGPIYLSLMGEVYDVTAGREYYDAGSGYSFFAGRDGTISFFTGNYDPDHVNDKTVLDYEGPEIMAMEQWRDFYEDHEEYRFLGVLDGEYYDSTGKETPYLLKIREKVMIAKIEVEVEERQRQERLSERRKMRLEKKKAAEAEKAKDAEL